MKSLRIFLGDQLLIFADIDKAVSNLDIAQGLNRCVDKLCAIRTTTPVVMDESDTRDLWQAYLEEFADAMNSSVVAIMSKRRSRPLPQLRHMAAAAWMEASHERVGRVAYRLRLDHSSVVTGMQTLADLMVNEDELKDQYKAAILIARRILKEGVVA